MRQARAVVPLPGFGITWVYPSRRWSKRRSASGASSSPTRWLPMKLGGCPPGGLTTPIGARLRSA